MTDSATEPPAGDFFDEGMWPEYCNPLYLMPDGKSPPPSLFDAMPLLFLFYTVAYLHFSFDYLDSLTTYLRDTSKSNHAK